MNVCSRPFQLLSAIALAAFLAACGGGGGGGDDSGSSSGGSTGGGSAGPDGSTDVVSSSGNLKDTWGKVTYPTGFFKDGVFVALTNIRMSAGAGALSQNTSIDEAAQAHADYLEANEGQVTDFHSEEQAKTGFTGVTSKDRMEAAGFTAGMTNEVIGGTTVTDPMGCVYGLANSVYHAATLLGPYTMLGIGNAKDGAGQPTCVIDFATAADDDKVGQVPGAGKIVAYPFDGMQNLAETFYVAMEVPRPSATLFPSLIAGTPVLVSVRNADYLNFGPAGTLNPVITKFELKDMAGKLVPAHILANPAIKAGAGVTMNPDSKVPTGFAVLVPHSPLVKDHLYTASFEATLKTGGTKLRQTWSFRTTAN